MLNQTNDHSNLDPCGKEINRQTFEKQFEKPCKMAENKAPLFRLENLSDPTENLLSYLDANSLLAMWNVSQSWRQVLIRFQDPIKRRFTRQADIIKDIQDNYNHNLRYDIRSTSEFEAQIQSNHAAAVGLYTAVKKAQQEWRIYSLIDPACSSRPNRWTTEILRSKFLTKNWK